MNWITLSELNELKYDGYVYIANPKSTKIECIYKRRCNTFFNSKTEVNELADCLFAIVFIPDFPHEEFKKEPEPDLEYHLYTRDYKHKMRFIGSMDILSFAQEWLDVNSKDRFVFSKNKEKK